MSNSNSNSLKISDHFYLEEVSTTQHRNIPNEPPQEVINTAIYVAMKMETMRALLGNKPISVSSWYRSPKLNAAVGGSTTSQHLKGEAVDFICPAFGTPYEIAHKLNQHKLAVGFDQLIYEGNWVHISFVVPPRVPRLEALTWMLDKSYKSGILAKRSA